VLIDGNYETKDGVQVYHPRDPEELKRLEEVVKNAIGFDAARGDSIRVEGAKFSHLDLPDTEPRGFRIEKNLPYVLAGLGLLTLGAMMFIFLRAIKGPAPLLPQPALAGAEAAPELGGVATASVLGGSASEPSLESAPDPAQLEEKRALAIEFASKDPAGAALILSQWLASPEDAKPLAAGEGA
jgi:flagellar M-ring protein FliF